MFLLLLFFDIFLFFIFHGSHPGSHGSHGSQPGSHDSHSDSHDSLARTLGRPVSPSMLIVNRGTIEVRTEGILKETIKWFTMGDVPRMNICMKSNAAMSYMYNVDGNNYVMGK